MESKDQVEKKVLEFFSKIEPEIPFDNCIIDFVIVDDQVKIVELNPFVIVASVCVDRIGRECRCCTL